MDPQEENNRNQLHLKENKMNIVKVRINDDGSINLWKLPQELDSTWRDAVLTEKEPTLTTKQLAIPQYDLSKTPIQVSYSIIEASLDERKSNEKNKARSLFLQTANQQAHNEIADNSEIYDAVVVEQTRLDMIAKLEAISSATTHEELDEIV
jgi:hypothetical protein